MIAKNNKINFTKSALYNLKKPAKNFVTYRDQKVRGLYLYITKNGVISFFVQKKLKGKPIIVNIGQFPYISVENARTKGMELLTQIANGINPKDAKETTEEAKKEEKDELKLDELFEVYIKKHAKVHKKMWKEDIDQYKVICKEEAGKKEDIRYKERRYRGATQ